MTLTGLPPHLGWEDSNLQPDVRVRLRSLSSDLSCSINRKTACMTKITSMTPPIPRGTIVGRRVGLQPIDEAEHF
jgi:hypothetical protein